ncbi:MAG: 4Fe-4S dicluster domain-containing protein [Planctomycetia bacterium]|nr:4Fe-4S dicluster domain-containing protein [Planctomycetia bacterium]
MSLQKPEMVARVEALAHTSVADCYQCGKCTAGCPQAGIMDLVPSRLIRLVQTNEVREAAAANAPWQCVSCLTCSARCPKLVNIAGVLDALKQISVEEGITSKKYAATVDFQKEFLRCVRRNGRTNELELVGFYKIRRFLDDFSIKAALSDSSLGPKMLVRGKLHFAPGSPVKDKAVVKRIFEKCGVKGL